MGMASWVVYPLKWDTTLDRRHFLDEEVRIQEIFEECDTNDTGYIDSITWSIMLSPLDLPKIVQSCSNMGRLADACRPTDEEITLLNCSMYNRGRNANWARKLRTVVSDSWWMPNRCCDTNPRSTISWWNDNVNLIPCVTYPWSSTPINAIGRRVPNISEPMCGPQRTIPLSFRCQNCVWCLHGKWMRMSSIPVFGLDDPIHACHHRRDTQQLLQRIGGLSVGT